MSLRNESKVTLTGEIGISYEIACQPIDSLYPYFIRQIGAKFLLFLKGPECRALGWLSPETGQLTKKSCDECEPLRKATALDCDANGMIHVLSEPEKRISTIDHQGNLLRLLPLRLPGKPISIRCLDEGLLLIGTWKPGGLYLLDEAGHILWSFCPGDLILNEARSAFCVSSKYFYIADAGLHRILVINTEREIVSEYGVAGVPGAGLNRLSNPFMLEPCKDGSFLVCDTRNHRILKIGDNGNTEWEWPGRITSRHHPTQLFLPRCVRESSDGGLVIADTHNLRILSLDSGLNVTKAFGTTPVRSRELSFPRSVQPLANGNYLIADTYNNRVVEMDRNSKIHWQFKKSVTRSLQYELFWPRRALRLNDGRTVIADGRNNRIVFLGSDRKLLKVIHHIRMGSGLSELNDPHDVIQIPGGNFLVVDTGNDRLLEIDHEGNCLRSYPREKSESLMASDPHHVSFGPGGDVILSDTGNNRVLILDSQLKLKAQLSELRLSGTRQVTSLREPRGCYYIRGFYWILDSGNSRIVVVNDSHQVVWSWQTVLESSPLRYVSLPRWLSVLSPGNIILSDYLNSRVVLLRPRFNQSHLQSHRF